MAWRIFYHTDPVTCLRVFTRVWVTIWKAAAPSLPLACTRAGILALPLLVAPAPAMVPPAPLAAAHPVAGASYGGAFAPAGGTAAFGGSGSAAGTPGPLGDAPGGAFADRGLAAPLVGSAFAGSPVGLGTGPGAWLASPLPGPFPDVPTFASPSPSSAQPTSVPEPSSFALLAAMAAAAALFRSRRAGAR